VSVPKASLKPHLNEIRQWVEQGRTDIWIAHALGSTPASISAFRSAHGILRRDLEGRGSTVPPPIIPPDAPPPEEPARPRRRARRRTAEKPAREPARAAKEQPKARRGGRRRAAAEEAPPPAAEQEAPAAAAQETVEALATSAHEPPAVDVVQAAPAGTEASEPASKRRRRGGRGRGRRAPTYEATLDAGEEGYGFWIDGAVRDDPVFAEHWTGRRALRVRISAEEIVVRPDGREGEDGEG
jgi:hypothetical protein